MYLLGLVGAKGCGKSALAHVLADRYGFQRMRLADTLKSILRSVGLTHEQVDGDDKEVPCSLLLGHTPRYAMQTLGTEWGRNCIGKDFWVQAFEHRIMQTLPTNPHQRIVIDDIRFPNEAEMVARLGGYLWRIRRPEVEPPYHTWTRILSTVGLGGHESEQHWRTLPCQREIQNDADLGVFIERAQSALPEWFD